MDKKRRANQVSQYDKIFKENIEAVIPSLMQNILGIIAISSEELPDDLQHTKERKPDFLKKITDINENVYVLQIEFQVADESEMIYRMGEYYFMLERKYKLPVKQFVIYIGTGIPKMPSKLDREELKFRFPIIILSEIDYHIFLKSQKPEEIILGILASFEKDDPESALKHIINRIEETAEGDFAIRRYFNQLRVLSQLRNLEQKLKAIIMDNIAKYIDEKKDVAYLIGIDTGIDIGIDKGKEVVIKNLLLQTDFGLDKIANLTNVAVDVVKKIKEKL